MERRPKSMLIKKRQQRQSFIKGLKNGRKSMKVRGSEGSMAYASPRKPLRGTFRSREMGGMSN